MRQIAALCIILATLVGCTNCVTWYSSDNLQHVEFNVLIQANIDDMYKIGYKTSTDPAFIISNIENVGFKCGGMFIPGRDVDRIKIELITPWNELNKEKKKQFGPYVLRQRQRATLSIIEFVCER